MPESQRQTFHITFHSEQNITYSGTLLVNWTSSHEAAAGNATGDNGQNYDNVGASYYVIAVVLVYGMSIVMLIASHIKRRVDKVVEDKQIDKYLQDFQIVKERHARDSYRNLKRAIVKKINWEKQQKKPTYHNLQRSIVPLIAIGIPGGGPENLTDAESQSVSSSLSNVDLAAAEQYMIAKDRGKVYHSGKRTGNKITAAYFAAVKRLSREQSPRAIAKMFKERKISRDMGYLPSVPPAHWHSERAVPEYHNTERPRIDSRVLVEEGDWNRHQIYIEEPDTPEYSAPASVHGPRRKLAVPFRPPGNELFVPAPWYSNPSETSSPGNSPVEPHRLFPGFADRRSSPGGSGPAVPGWATPVSPSPRGSPRLSSSPRSTSSILSDGSREELIHITCL